MTIDRISRVPAALKGRVADRLRSWKLFRIHRDDRLRHPDEYAVVDPIASAYAVAGGVDHPYYTYSLVELGRLLARYHPRSILELGSGGSTAVFAGYARGSDAFVVSVDEDERWLEVTRSLVGEAAGVVELVPAPRVVKVAEGSVTGIAYDLDRSVLDRGFDLVLVDGPSLMVDGTHHSNVPNTDIFELADRPPAIILVDKRRATVAAIRERWGHLYDCRLSDVLTGSVRPRYRYFTVFRGVVDSARRR